MQWHEALMEWDENGLSNIPNENVLDFMHALTTEMITRDKNKPLKRRKQKPRYHCQYCQKGFPSNINLSQHISDFHSFDDDIPF